MHRKGEGLQLSFTEVSQGPEEWRLRQCDLIDSRLYLYKYQLLLHFTFMLGIDRGVLCNGCRYQQPEMDYAACSAQATGILGLSRKRGSG